MADGKSSSNWELTNIQQKSMWEAPPGSQKELRGSPLSSTVCYFHLFPLQSQEDSLPQGKASWRNKFWSEMGRRPTSRVSFSVRSSGTWQFTSLTYPFAKAKAVRAYFSKDRRREMEFYGATELSDTQGDPKCPYHFRRVFWMSLIR